MDKRAKFANAVSLTDLPQNALQAVYKEARPRVRQELLRTAHLFANDPVLQDMIKENKRKAATVMQSWVRKRRQWVLTTSQAQNRDYWLPVSQLYNLLEYLPNLQLKRSDTTGELYTGNEGRARYERRYGRFRGFEYIYGLRPTIPFLRNYTPQENAKYNVARNREQRRIRTRS